MTPLRLVSLLCLTLGVLSSASARAQQPEMEHGAGASLNDPKLHEARAHFRLGVDFFKERNYRGALIEFRTAYELRPNYKLLYNLGQACVELNEYANAIDYFTRYLAESGNELPAGRRQETEQLVKSLQRRMATVTVTSNEPDAEIFVNDTLVGRLPEAQEVALAAGRHRVTAKKAGLVNVEVIVELSAGEQRPLDMNFTYPMASAGASDGDDDGWRITPAVIGTAIGTGVLLAGAATLSLITLQAEHEYDATRRTLTSAEQLDDLRSDAVTKARITDVLWGTSLAGAALTATLFALSQDDDEEKPPARRPSLALQLGETSGVTLRGAF